VVKNKRWSTICFETLNRKEHFFESELTDFTDDLLYQGMFSFIILLDKINLLELYNGLQRAHKADSSLGLEQTIKHLEHNYREILSHNDSFLQMERALMERVANKPQVHTV